MSRSCPHLVSRSPSSEIQPPLKEMGPISQFFILTNILVCGSFGLPPSPGEDAPASLVILPAPVTSSFHGHLYNEVQGSRTKRSPQEAIFLRSLDHIISLGFQKGSVKQTDIGSNIAVAQKKIDDPSPSITSRITVKRYKHEPNVAVILNTGAVAPKNYKIDTNQLYLDKSLTKRIHHSDDINQAHDGITYQYVYGYPQHHHVPTSYGSVEHSTVTHQPHIAEVAKPVQYIYKAAIDHHTGTAVTSSLNPHEHEYASKYQYGYQIRDPKTSAFFGHSEARDVHLTKGHYHVLLPDGRLQRVEYWADKSGFHAQVSYNGAAKHPETHQHL